MSSSENLNELFTALSKAQAEMRGALKDADNPFFKSRYSDLSSVWESCRGPLTKHGLSIIQITGQEDGKLVLKTRLCHSSGQWLEGVMPILMAKQDSQSLGSAVSYTRRYSLSAIIGGYAVDDDGEEAMGRDLPKAPVSPQASIKAKPQAQLPPEQRDRLVEAMGKFKWKHADVQNLARILYQTSNIPALTSDQVGELTMLVASGTVTNITDGAIKERGETWE
jgi:hypothetical protein